MLAGHLCNLQDWLVSETTLQDVFIRVVAAHEHEGDEADQSTLNTLAVRTHADALHAQDQA